MLTLKNIWPSIVRTLVPAIVTYLLSIPLVPRIFDWLGIGQDDRNAWTARAITWVLFAVYYIASRFLEEHKSAFGWLLGLAKAPAYPVQAADVTDGGVHVVTTLAPTGGNPDKGGAAEDGLDEDAPDDAERGDATLIAVAAVLVIICCAVYLTVTFIHHAR